MSSATAAAAATTEKPATAKLIVPRGDALKHLRAAHDRGGEIKAARIRNGDDLDKARGLKLEWIQGCTELLEKLFDNTSVADYCNDWVGKIFPEYAEFGNFVDQFYEEMDYRLGKLRTVLKRVEQASESTASSPAAATAAAEPAEDAKPAASGGNGNGNGGHGRPASQGAAAETKAQATKSASTNASPSHSESTMGASAASAAASPAGNKVLFVSHGPKDPSSEAVLQFVQQLSMAVVEADHTNGLIDTLEARNDMGFAIVMNVADHVENGKASLSDSSLFKLGYAAGKIGLKRMCMMHGPAQPTPNGEAHGIAHMPVDVNGGWQLHLARQMKRAGLDIDLNRLA
ncbi:MAG TPA: hypothetical protein VER17_18355 [Tepidisphaeraceae bacterium]|nr:hypothetical protein [Tepidisphaeraceae bacterium]